MTVLTGTVTVNAAFLQEIKEDNRQLRRLFSDADQILTQFNGDHADWRQLHITLEDLCDQLAMHFALEEAYGYFDDAIDVAPRLSEHAEALRREHAHLFANICELSQAVDRLMRQPSSARSFKSIELRFVSFRQQLQAHEARENELILQSLDDDLGVGD